MFKDDYGDAAAAGGRGGKRKRERERHDAQKTMKPSEYRLGVDSRVEIDRESLQCLRSLVLDGVDEWDRVLRNIWFK
jgi:hypothetical protein